MRVPLLPIVAIALAACILPDPADLEFVEGAVLDDGRLVRDFLFTDGSPDCRVEFDLDRAYGDPDNGCDACDVSLAVDLVVTGDNCDTTPPDLATTQYDVSIGFDDDQAWSQETGIWERWLDGDRHESSFEGSGDRTGAGFDVQEELDLEWLGE